MDAGACIGESAPNITNERDGRTRAHSVESWTRVRPQACWPLMAIGLWVGVSSHRDRIYAGSVVSQLFKHAIVCRYGPSRVSSSDLGIDDEAFRRL